MKVKKITKYLIFDVGMQLKIQIINRRRAKLHIYLVWFSNALGNLGDCFEHSLATLWAVEWNAHLLLHSLIKLSFPAFLPFAQKRESKGHTRAQASKNFPKKKTFFLSLQQLSGIFKESFSLGKKLTRKSD